MLLIGYFECLGSQLGIAWRCADSLSLQAFLGLASTEDSPDHSSLSVVRDSLPFEVHATVFDRVLTLARERNILNGRTLGVDSTTLEASAARKSTVGKDTGESWQAFLTTLMRDACVIGPDDTPCIDEMKRFDRSRKDKKVLPRVETGGARRTWLRGIEKVRKRYLLAAHNLGCPKSEQFGIGTPRSLQGAARVAAALRFLRIACVTCTTALWSSTNLPPRDYNTLQPAPAESQLQLTSNEFSTGC